VHGVCRLTGVADRLSEAGFTLKYGGTYRWGANPAPWTFSFSLSPMLAGERSFAYQVERSRFDQILLNHARDCGADVRQNHTVTGIMVNDDRVCGVEYRDAGGLRGQIRARYTVDASGNGSRIFREVGPRKYSDFFRSIALYGYFEGGKRLPAPKSGNILSVAFDAGWFWYIPLTDTLTSVGAVVSREEADRVQGDPEAALRALIAQCPMISEYLRDARRVTTGEYGKVRTRKDYSYHNTHYWRPGMALVGDAACFVDPVFSTGVHLATYSERRYRREYSAFYEYLMCFYDMHVSQDSYFWSAKKITNSTKSDVESFVELVGGVSSQDVAFASPDLAVRHAERRSKEYAAAVGELVANRETSMLPLYRTSIVQKASLEGAQIQTSALLGDEGESPLFDGGLVPTTDGMGWQHTK
jgi:halogenation protein CepH